MSDAARRGPLSISPKAAAPHRHQHHLASRPYGMTPPVPFDTIAYRGASLFIDGCVGREPGAARFGMHTYSRATAAGVVGRLPARWSARPFDLAYKMKRTLTWLCAVQAFAQAGCRFLTSSGGELARARRRRKTRRSFSRASVQDPRRHAPRTSKLA
jgi:hypothetical protein